MFSSKYQLYNCWHLKLPSITRYANDRTVYT